MIRVGIVVSTESDHAQVSTARRGPCGDCSSGAACAMPLLPLSNDVERITAQNPIGARPGDQVEIDLAGHTELGVSVLVWMVPIVGLIGGAIGGVLLHGVLGLGEDPGALLGAGAGCAVAYLGLRQIDRRLTDDPRLLPRITKVITHSSCPTLPAVKEHAARGAGCGNDQHSF